MCTYVHVNTGNVVCVLVYDFVFSLVLVLEQSRDFCLSSTSACNQPVAPSLFYYGSFVSN